MGECFFTAKVLQIFSALQVYFDGESLLYIISTLTKFPLCFENALISSKVFSCILMISFVNKVITLFFYASSTSKLLTSTLASVIF